MFNVEFNLQTYLVLMDDEKAFDGINGGNHVLGNYVSTKYRNQLIKIQSCVNRDTILLLVPILATVNILMIYQ